MVRLVRKVKYYTKISIKKADNGREIFASADGGKVEYAGKI